ncbi:putative beta-1,4-xylosyltransferase IRX9H isoform X2 [Tasmannia lanceolata]|uniref:putative beta-1,4-xylosyltransferase IRX9H isoform X2 n=1 Tax=Tasmannia lanceolata TaxID=3420 RepID=UPI004063BD7C
MASFRRTMSVVPRDGAVSNGETFSVSSPSHKLPYTQNYSPSGGLVALFSSVDFLEVLHRIRAIVLNIFSRRSSRHLERSKSKAQFWKRAFFHFFVCFMVGMFIGFTPFISMDFSTDLVSKHQAFSFKDTDIVGNRASFLENKDLKVNVSSEKEDIHEPRSEISDTFSAPYPVQYSNFMDKKLLIIVTPTHPRPFQAYYLSRLAHTLRLIPPHLLWIVVEMSSQSVETAEILRKSGIMYRHLVCEANLTSIKDKCAHQRNAALSHIEKHRLDGIVYFADDHNVYSVDIFEQMRKISRFGTWPVAMLMGSKNKAILDGPVCNNSQVVGWHTNERTKRIRRFHSDMSGFAFNSTILWDPKRWHRPTPESIRQLDKVNEGLQASTFIEQVVEDESQMEGLPMDCSRIMVWHLHLEAPQLSYPQGWSMQKNLDIVAPLM